MRFDRGGVSVGCLVAFFGILILLEPTYFSAKWGRVIDLREVQKPFALFLIAGGAIWIKASIRVEKK